MPQTLVVTNVIDFCHLTDPVVGEVQVGGVVFTEAGQLKQSVGEGERHGPLCELKEL